MFVLSHGAGFLMAMALFCSVGQAQFLPEQEIPLTVQTQIIEHILAQQGHLDMVLLEHMFREWLLSQPVPNVTGSLLDDGRCQDCVPPTEHQDAQFPPVRDIRIGHLSHSQVQPNFTVRWRAPAKLPRQLQNSYVLDHYEVYLSTEQGVYEQYTVGRSTATNNRKRPPLQIRFRNRLTGNYTISVRPVYVRTEISADDDDQSTTTPDTSEIGSKALWVTGHGIVLDPVTTRIDDVLPASRLGSNLALRACVLSNDHQGSDFISTVDVLQCAWQSGQTKITNLAQLSDFSNLRILDINDHDVCNISPLQNLTFMEELILSSNHRLTGGVNCPSNPLGVLDDMPSLRYLFLDDIGLTDVPALAANADFVSVSLADNTLSNTSFTCSSTAPIPVSFLNISGNGLQDGDLRLLSRYAVSSLNASDNNFKTFKNPDCTTDVFAHFNSIDLSNNVSSASVGLGLVDNKPLSGDIGTLNLAVLNLSKSNFTSMPAHMPLVCIDLDLSDMDELMDWPVVDVNTIPIVRPYAFSVSHSETLSCRGSQFFRYWMSAGNGANQPQNNSPNLLGPSIGGNGICPILGAPLIDVFAQRCAAGTPILNVERSGEFNQHLLSWDELAVEGHFRAFIYRAQKRLAGIHDPNSDTGQIGPDYLYGETGGAMVSDTLFDLAYEFRIQRCLLVNNAQECGDWSVWVEGSYPLIQPLNPQIIWLDPITGSYQVRWSYTQSYFEGHGNVNYFFVDYPGSSQPGHYVNAGGFQSNWNTTTGFINTHGNHVSIQACSDNQTLDNCGQASTLSFTTPAAVDVNLIPPAVSNIAIAGNEVSFHLTNMTLAVDPENDNKTVLDYYQIIETSAQGGRIDYRDVSNQNAGVSSEYKIKRYSGGSVDFSIKACVRNRFGDDSCSSTATTVTATLAQPAGYNDISESLCWRNRGDDGSGLDVQLEWNYSTTDANTGQVFEQPGYYGFDPFGVLGNDITFFLDAQTVTSPSSGLSIVNQDANNTHLAQDTWTVHACPGDSPAGCQAIGVISARANGDVMCSTPTPPPLTTATREGGPGDLRAGVWSNQTELPRQGWSFYWASDLRYDQVHEEYGDTYDLYAYWQTYQLNNRGIWDAVWLYAQLKQIDESSAGGACVGDRLGFSGGLYYPNSSVGVEDISAGQLSVCFDPDNNSMVNIVLDVDYGPGLNTHGIRSYDLSEISTDTSIFPPAPPVNSQDFLNGSFGLNTTINRAGKTKIISWTYSFLEALIVLGFDQNNQPMWINGVLDCRIPGNDCDINSINGVPDLNAAGFEFSTAQWGIPAFANPPVDGADLGSVLANVNTVTRDKVASADQTVNAVFALSGQLNFNFNDGDGVFLRSFAHNFNQTVVRESSFHDIRFNGDNVTSNNTCTLVNNECALSFTWFSDTDFLGTGVPSVHAFYQRDGAAPQAMDGAFCGAGNPVADPDNAFSVLEYSCVIAQPGRYVFTLMNRVNSDGTPIAGASSADVITIARSQTLNVFDENNANDNLAVAQVADTPLQVGVTTHDHSIAHTASIGTLAGQASVSGGAASYTIPINIAPGRQSMQPSVSLNYNSRAGNGSVGVGWSLSAGSAIGRCPSTVAQDGFGKGVSYDNSDRLCLDGQRLMLVSGDYWGTASVYRGEIDGFARITLNGSGAANSGCAASFEVNGKDNITRHYGDGSDQQVRPTAVSGGGCVANAWLLTQEQDQAGNSVDYQYTRYGDGEQLLSRIDYTGNSISIGNRSVRFAYGARSVANQVDKSVSYLAGYRSEQSQRLSSISSFVGNQQVRQYKLTHIISDASARLLLQRVQECAYENNIEVACLPFSEFDWGDQAPFFAWQAIQTAQDTDELVNDLLVDGDPLGYDSINNRVNGGQLEQGFDLDGDGSRELMFSDQNARYIASIDAQGVERWRVSMDLSTQSFGANSGRAAEFMLLSSADSSTEVLRYQDMVESYVASIDLETRRSPTEKGPISAQEALALQNSITENVNEQLTALFRNRLPRRNDVDYDGDGIVDLHGVVPDANNSNTHYFAFALSGAASIQSGSFESQFTVLPTDIAVSISAVTGLPLFQAVIGDINGDGLMDVLDRVSISVVDNDGDSVITEGLRLWVNVDNPATTNVIEYQAYNGAAMVPSNATNGIAGVIYIWPYNIAVDINGSTSHQREISALPSLVDYNGDGLQDIVISSNVLELVYQNTQFADLSLDVIVQSGYQQAGVRVLLNRSSALGEIDFDIAELSDDTVANDPYSRGSAHLGLFSDPRITYQVPMDVNGDGLQDYLFTPNNNDRLAEPSLCANNPDGCWYLQLNLGGAIHSVQSIFSAPIQVNLPANIANSLRTSNQATGRIIVPAQYGNLIQPMDWNNDGRTELLLPRELEQAACVALRHSQAPDNFGEYCPVNMNGEAPSFIQQGMDGDFNTGGLAYAESHRTGFGHLDRSSYKMGALEFDISSLDLINNSISAVLIDHDVTGIIASNRSAVNDSLGDGQSDLLTVFGCVGEVPGAVTTVGDNFTRCRTSGPLASVNASNTALNGLLDQAATTAYTPGASSGTHRGYYASRNTVQRGHSLDLMLSATDGFGNQSNWHYAPLSSNADRAETDIPLYVVPDRSNGDGYVDNADGEYFYFASSMYVVSQFDQSNGLLDGSVRLQNSTYYGYEEAVFNNQGRGFQGFRKVVSEQVMTNPVAILDDPQNNLRSVSVFYQLFPLAGRMQASYTQLASIAYDPMQDRDSNGAFQMPSNTISNTLDVWGCRIGSGSLNAAGSIVGLCNTDNAISGGINIAQAQVSNNLTGGHGIYQPVMISQSAESKEPNNHHRVYASSSSNAISTDAYGNNLRSTVVSNNTSIAGASDTALLTHSQTVNNSYTNNESNWWIGRMDRSITTFASDYPAGNTGAEQNKTSSQLMSYNPTLRKPSCLQTVDGNSSAHCGAATGVWQTSEYVYDSHGNPTLITVSASNLTRSRSTSTRYSTGSDAGYFPAGITNSQGHTVSTQIEPREGDLVMIRDANDLLTHMSYDPFGRNIERWYPLSINVDASDINQHYAPRSSIRYSASCTHAPIGTAYCVTRISDGSPVVVQAFDAFNRLQQVRSNGFASSTRISEQSHNARGQLVHDTVARYSNGARYENEYRFDALGRQVLKVEPTQTTDSNSVQYRYSHTVHNGLLSTVLVGIDQSVPSCSMIDAPLTGGVCVNRSYASNGWLLSSTDAHNGVTRYYYDGQGNPTQILDINGNATHASYNNLGHRNSLDDPNMGVWSYQYNGLGELISQTDAKQQNVNYLYDDLGRLIERTAVNACSNNDTVDSWNYDSSARQGILISTQRNHCNGSSINRSYDHDPYLRPIATRHSINNPNTSVTNINTTMRYDRYFARPNAMTWNLDGTGTGVNPMSTLRMYNKYDRNGYLTEQGDSRHYVGDTAINYSIANPGAWRNIQAMSPAGQIQTQQYGNGLTQSNQYYPASWQMQNSFIADPQPQSPDFMNYFYEYDLFGNLNRQTSHNTINNEASVDEENFSYDRLHRLKTSTRVHSIGINTTTMPAVNYQYDAIGNLLSKSDYANSYQYNDTRPNAVSQVTLNNHQTINHSYDDNGAT